MRSNGISGGLILGSSVGSRFQTTRKPSPIVRKKNTKDFFDFVGCPT